MDLEQQIISKNNDSYFGDPINAFSIIKRLVVDWKYYDKLLSMTSEYNGKNLLNYLDLRINSLIYIFKNSI